MKKRAEVLAVSLSAVLLLLYWLPVQHGHCSEQNQLDLQNQPQTSQDVIEQPEETKLDRKKEETAAQDAPDLHTTDHSTATDLDSGDKLQIHESELQKRNEEELQVDGTAADPALPLDTTTLEHNPDPSASESSSPPEQDTNLLKTDLSPLPAGLTTELPEPNPATDPDPVLQPSTSTALPAPAHCSAAENSCSSASVTTVPSTAVSSTTGACDAGENTPNDTDLSSYDSLPVVLENTSSSDTAKGTKTALDGASPGINISSKLKEQSVHISPETDPSVPKDQEDIPTFDEWKKIMMEVENEKSQTTHTSCNGGSSSVKKVQKTTNYASVECGAKILSSNPEAKSTSAILMENMDVYMLNPCSNKIWFIIELCQPIQVKQLDIANFELFSSTPKDFLVSISDRYPTNKWAKLGTFHARDERTIQSFPLDEHLYAKYVKVELLSHFGSEHFCPLSLIRVFGTSMMEEYELNSEPSERLNLQDEDYDYPAGYMPSDDKSSKNIIGSAKDAIMNMVNNIAANVLGGDQEDAARSGGNYSSIILNATETPAVPPSSYMPLETMEVDKQDVSEITETTSVTRDGETGGVSPSSTATILEPPSSTQPEADSISPTPTNEEQIVTLLPKEEDEDLTANKSEKPSSSDQTQRAETDRDERHSSANRCETTPHSCSCVVSLEEYLFRKCFPLSASHKRISGITSHESSSQPGSHTQGSQLSVHVVVPSSVTHSFIAETSSVPESSGTDLVDPVWPNEEKRPGVVGSLDLAPSLTSSLPKLAPTDGPAAKPTRSVDFPALSAVELPQVKLPDQEKTKEEQSEIRKTPIVTSHVQSASAPVLSTGVNEVPHEKKPPAVEKSEIETSPTSVAPISTPNTTTDQSLSPQTKTRPTSSTPTLPSTPATESLEATATVGSDPKSSEELLEDVPQGGQSGAGHAGASSQGQTGQPPSSSEFYAEMQSTTDVPISGSNQKESVFMRLNNRIKALEVNMSLSGRYLEQLSQRYRKQMEEMQKAFNKTIIKLQNTSRIAEEQDQKQTESIQVLQGQLENVTKLVLNLSVRVSQLQREVSDRHSYLLLSLLLCLLLGLVVFINFCRMSAENPSVEPETSAPSTYSFCCPDSCRASSGYEDANPKRRASFPFAQSSLQIAATEGPNEAYNVETRRNSTGNNKKKKRCKMKQIQPPETITPTVLSLSAVPNGLPLPCNTLPPGKAHSDLGPTPGNGTVLPHPFRDPASEGSSEGSSHSDEPSFCGIATCGRFCEGLPPPKSRSDKRSYKRRRSKLGSGAELEQLLQPVQCNGPPTGHGDALRGLIGDSGGSGNSQFGVTRAGVTTNKTTTVPGVL